MCRHRSGLSCDVLFFTLASPSLTSARDQVSSEILWLELGSPVSLLDMADEQDDTPSPPQNFSEDMDDLKVHAAGVMAVDDDFTVGLLTILTQMGHYDFLINQEIANMIVQQLREFISGDSDKLPDE